MEFKMIFISNGGNLNGKSSNFENNPDQIQKCFDLNLNIKLDVWFKDEKFWLGSDKPNLEVNPKMLEDYRVWCQAKNIEALDMMLLNHNINCFIISKDKFTITSKGFIWNVNQKNIPKRSVIQINDDFIFDKTKLTNCYAICSNNPIELLGKF